MDFVVVRCLGILITYLLGTAVVDVVVAVSVVVYFTVVVIINVEKVSCFFKNVVGRLTY